MKKENKRKLILIIFCLIIAFISIFICSKNSPLYPFNNWVDENSFFTMGKAWMHGLIPYKDLFEQKGPLLYFIFMIGYFISNDSFFGIFIFEVISLTICLYYLSKIVELFLKRKYSYLIIPVFSAIICSSKFFVHGGSAEELIFPLLSISMYYLLRNFEKKEITYLQLFINGLFAGLVAMIKFNLLGFWFAFMLSIFLYFIFNKKVKKAFLGCLFFLLGMIIPIGIFFIYFLCVDGFKEFIDTYIIFNITGYGKKLSFFERIYKMIKTFYHQLNTNPLIYISMVMGTLYCLLSKKLLKNKYSKIVILLCMGFSFLGIYWGNLGIIYYFLFMEFFIFLGLISFFYQIKDNRLLFSKGYYLTLTITIILSILLLFTSDNLEYRKNKKEDLVQYKFAKEINKNKTKDTTMLNYAFLDGGFYFASDILPNTKYFELQNADILDRQETYDKEMSERKFDYIVLRKGVDFDPTTEYLTNNYDIIMEENDTYETLEFTYILYKKKEW